MQGIKHEWDLCKINNNNKKNQSKQKQQPSGTPMNRLAR
jgi:hypothetical protein